MLQAKAKASGQQAESQSAGVSDDMQAGWRMRAGSALEDLTAQKAEQYDSLNIQVKWLLRRQAARFSNIEPPTQYGSLYMRTFKQHHKVASA